MTKSRKHKPSVAKDDARRTAGCRRVEIAIAWTIYGQFLSSTQTFIFFSSGDNGLIPTAPTRRPISNVRTGILQIATAKR